MNLEIFLYRKAPNGNCQKEKTTAEQLALLKCSYTSLIFKKTLKYSTNLSQNKLKGWIVYYVWCTVGAVELCTKYKQDWAVMINMKNILGSSFFLPWKTVHFFFPWFHTLHFKCTFQINVENPYTDQFQWGNIDLWQLWCSHHLYCNRDLLEQSFFKLFFSRNNMPV